MSRFDRQHARQNTARKPPPTAGAVDLGALKQPDASEEQIQAAIGEMLGRNNLVCVCGERVRADGVEVVAVVRQDTPNGAAANLMLGMNTFHSASCPKLVEWIANDVEPRSLVMRRLGEVIWLDEGDE